MGAKKNLAEKVLAALNISVEGTIVKNFVNQTVNGVLTTLVVLMVALNFAKKMRKCVDNIHVLSKKDMMGNGYAVEINQ